MAKKDKVKAAKEREQQRLYYKSHPDEKPEQPPVEKAKPAKTNKDSHGKKIPTEIERRDKGELPKRARKALDTKGKPSLRKSDKAENGLGKVVSVAKRHPLMLLICLVILIAAIVAASLVFSGSEQEQSVPDDISSPAISLIGITEDGRSLINDTGKFEGFWQTDKDENISWADLMDQRVSVEEQKILEERGQTVGKDGIRTYNEKISSAADAKAEQKAKAEEAQAQAKAAQAQAEAQAKASDEHKESAFG